VSNKLTKENERLLRIAHEALEECNKLHEATGQKKIPLDEVAQNLLANKEEIQNGFDLLVKMGIIGDDGDRDHMNYDENGTLMEFIEHLLELSAQEEEEEDVEITSAYAQPD
jgi:ribosome biogenesis SPOUT family RNA methylase Rps3